jgi:hypothetical protein
VNEPIVVRPTDGPLTVYVVAALFARRVSPSGVWGEGFGSEEVLLAHQFGRPGEHPLSRADACECGIQHIRKLWADVMGARSDPGHFAVVRANANATVIRPAAADSTIASESSGPQEPAHPAKRRKAKTPTIPEGDPS